VVDSIIVPYDAEWPRLFEAERARLEEVLAPWLERGIHHIGSTSVPGMAAKPIIDMIAGVQNLAEARAAFEPLSMLDYQHREHRPEAHCFWKTAPDKPLGATHHLHLTEPESDIWRERLAFRNALRADPALCAEYEQWKRRYASTTEPGRYTADKFPFVARVLAEANLDLKPDSLRLSARVLKNRQR
jgi:GrpB-like predicted nucleotidyltransferase (UPF0157 family)